MANITMTNNELFYNRTPASSFKKLSPMRKRKLKQALRVLESDKMIKSEYGWTGLFSLAGMMN